LVYLATDGSGAAASVSTLNSWSLDRATDKIDVTCFGDTNKVYVQGLPDLKGSFEGVWDDADTKVFTAAASTAAVRMYLYPSSDALTKYAYGIAWLDASINVGVADAIKISGDFVAGGSWTVNF
jgi:hypothetical protein